MASFPRSCDPATVDSPARELSDTDSSRRADTSIAMTAKSRARATSKKNPDTDFSVTLMTPVILVQGQA